MDIKITLKPNNKYIINNSYNSVLNITHLSKFNDKEKSILKLNTNNQDFPFAILQKSEFSQRSNLFIMNDKDIKSNNYITITGSPVDLYGIYEYEEIGNELHNFEIITKEIDDKEKFNFKKGRKEGEDEEEDVLRDVSPSENQGIEELLLSKKRIINDNNDRNNDNSNKKQGKLTNLLRNQWENDRKNKKNKIK